MCLPWNHTWPIGTKSWFISVRSSQYYNKSTKTLGTEVESYLKNGDFCIWAAESWALMANSRPEIIRVSLELGESDPLMRLPHICMRPREVCALWWAQLSLLQEGDWATLVSQERSLWLQPKVPGLRARSCQHQEWTALDLPGQCVLLCRTRKWQALFCPDVPWRLSETRLWKLKTIRQPGGAARTSQLYLRANKSGPVFLVSMFHRDQAAHGPLFVCR
jgi:hypothetical protein